ncbi:unnamed protein product [Fraxinus pennsylvanica]|uniref:Uncharacterized protein n=1 Tax=Fraxinus pennsylvanica TaxID=56036 RepID=A0AAD2EFG2_9LAMI|nr:unnamed protein product [Fraxinus pennsylvanica]
MDIDLIRSGCLADKEVGGRSEVDGELIIRRFCNQGRRMSYHHWQMRSGILCGPGPPGCRRRNFILRYILTKYLSDAGVQWGAAPAVKVFGGCKPQLDKILGILVEGHIDTCLGIFHEYETKNLKAWDTNGFVGSCLRWVDASLSSLEFSWEQIFLGKQFSSPGCAASVCKSLKSLKGVQLEKATESMTESVETPCRQRCPTHGSDDVFANVHFTIISETLPCFPKMF